MIASNGRGVRWRDAIALAGALVAASPVALANGAFPDSFNVLLPKDDQQKIIVSTNFGLIMTSDGGQVWEWVCEHDLGGGAFRYQWTDLDRILAVADTGLVFSDDLGCTWSRSAGAMSGVLVADFFVDPTNPRRVLAVGFTASGESQLLESDDGATTFARTLLTTPPGTALVSVETAFLDPKTIYAVSTISANGDPTQLAIRRSRDGGGTWDTFAISPALGTQRAGVVAVDRRDPMRLYLRTPNGTSDRLLLSSDGGATVTVALEYAGVLTSYVQRADGTLLVGGTSGVAGVLFQSTDAGATFTASTNAPNFRGLGERDGRIYGVGDDGLDGFTLALADASLRTWAPLMKFNDITRVRRCGNLSSACRLVCAGMRYKIALCAGVVPSVDGGPEPVDAVNDAVVVTRPGPGCHCTAAPTGHPGAPAVLPIAAAVLWLIRLRRRPRG
jgi:MYXO-CTERM domain-containing protein